MRCKELIALWYLKIDRVGSSFFFMFLCFSWGIAIKIKSGYDTNLSVESNFDRAWMCILQFVKDSSDLQLFLKQFFFSQSLSLFGYLYFINFFLYFFLFLKYIFFRDLWRSIKWDYSFDNHHLLLYYTFLNL